MKSKTGGLRYNEDKLKWGLVDFDALDNMVRVLMYGEQKYDAHNWKKGLPYVSVTESMLRHIYAFLRGEDVDPESGLPHTGHIMCNAMFLDYYWQHHKDMDDRFIDNAKKKENSTEQESS